MNNIKKMMEETEDLALLHPKLRPYVKVLLSHEFGLLKELPKIYNINCGSIIIRDQKQYGDRFHLKISYCRKPLNWQVLWNGFDITQAPDFIMEESFLAYATTDIIKTKVPSLINWSPQNIKCLLNVILELLQLYKSYQVHLLGITTSLQRYSFEYDTLLHMESLQDDDIEVCVCSANRTPVVIFLIHLKVNFSILPFALPNCKNLALLMIEFKDNSKNTIQLLPRIELEDVLGVPLDMPELPPDLSLMDYVHKIEHLLQKKVEKVTYHMHQRKMLYLYLVQFLEPALLNGDDISFKNVSFLLESNNFFCVLNIQIPESYPENKPTLQFFSLQKASNYRISYYNDYPYNQDMAEEDVAKNIVTYIRTTAIDEFHKNIT